LILGPNFISPSDVMSKLGMKYSDKELKSLEKIPWSAELLQELRDTHILFPTAPLSILETRAKSPAGLFHDQDWYNGKGFAKSERPEVRWNLVRKQCVPGSTSKTYSQQLTLLSGNEENLSAVVLVQLMVIHYLMTGTKLFQWEKNDGVRSSSVSDGYRVGVGFCRGRLSVGGWYGGDGCDSGLGVASVRKFQD
ncbi:MAG: hypothetical protein Q8L24_02855, partial [bacterium]|nr:hypothetical protein [bacterium]